ncbi:hypothetical protein [Microbulbifer hainanensis]|uniref:hypothetical protein n=1 Tax=Microbulbifer hainanensis TaxID=2735675 RepID=UPI0018663B9B|nr:hypothetical protein [Microbulbifer hainanensis]
MSRINEQLELRLAGTFKQYIRHAIQHSLTEDVTESDVLQVIVNIQAALELLSKLYVLKRTGWQGIIKPQFHKKPESEVLLAIENGTITTTPYWKNKEFISDEIYLNEDDKSLLDGFQNHRNQIMHLGMVTPSRETLNESIWFMVRIINQLDWQDTLPTNKRYMSNSLEYLLGDKLYKKLIKTSCYVDEAVDRAYELYDDVKPCIQCGNDSWALNEEDYRNCVVCGYRGNEDALGFIDCSRCNAKGTLIYDSLNITSNTFSNAKCCACGEIVPVSQCHVCEGVSKYTEECRFCGDQG